MCIAIEKPKQTYFCFDHEQYDAEVALMRKRIQKLMKKVEKNDIDLNYSNFRESLKNTNHENLKK